MWKLEVYTQSGIRIGRWFYVRESTAKKEKLMWDTKAGLKNGSNVKTYLRKV